MSTPAETAPEAPKIEIPSLASLTGKQSPAPDPKTVTPGDPAPAPVVESGDEKPTIPTDIFNAPPPTKTPAQFAEERKKAKQAKVQQAVEEATSEWQTKYEAEMAQRLEREKRLQELENELTRYKEELPQFKTLAEQRAAELEEARKSYFNSAQSIVSPMDDPDFVSANENLTRTLLASMPDLITTAEGTRSVPFENIAQDPAKMGQVEQAIGFYADARQKGDQVTMDRAISYVAMLLGAPVKISKDPNEEVLLERGSEDYKSINAALKAAVPHLQQKIGRLQAIEQDRPALVQRKLQQKTEAIRGLLNEQIFMPEDRIQETLQSDPANGVAIIAAMANAVPAIKERLEAAVAGLSTVFASVQDGFILPPPASNDPAAIKAHQEKTRAMHIQVASAMRNAAAFEAVGPILAQVISERDAALSRLEQHSKLTNPGSSAERPSGSDGKTSIPTDMFAVGS